MSRLEGFETCPRCGKNSLPRIQPDSKANAVKCQLRECGAVIGRKELDAERARLKAIDDAKKKTVENSTMKAYAVAITARQTSRKPVQHPKYLRFVRGLPCAVSGRTYGVESAHTGSHGPSRGIHRPPHPRSGSGPKYADLPPVTW